MISPVSGAALCALLTQDRELYDACFFGRLEDARSAVRRGADPNWKDEVSPASPFSLCVQ